MREDATFEVTAEFPLGDCKRLAPDGTYPLFEPPRLPGKQIRRATVIRQIVNPDAPALAGRTDLDDQLPEILPFKQADEGLRRIFQAVNHVFAPANLASPDPVSHDL